MRNFKRAIFFSLLFIIVGIPLLYTILHLIQEPTSLDEDTRSKTNGQFIQLSQGIVHYEIRGEQSKPLVALIGGAGVGYQVWNNNIVEIEEAGFRVLRYDHYGRGYSDRVQHSYSLKLFYNQFKELLDSLNIKEPIHVVGLSMGAMVAMEYTHEHPSLVKSLTLIDPAGINPFTPPLALKAPVLSDLLMTFYWRPQSVRKQMEEFYNSKRFNEYEEELERQIKIKGYKAAQHSIWLHALSTDMSSQVKKIGKQKLPVLLIWGKQDPRTLFNLSEYYLKHIPQAKFVAVDEAGHLSNYEKPNIVNKAMVDFLKDN